jgi:hypothetical protein
MAEYKRRLWELATSFHRDPKNTGAQCAGPLRIKPGTRLIRQWEGKTHHVTVGEAGFEYNGGTLQEPLHAARDHDLRAAGKQ